MKAGPNLLQKPCRNLHIDLPGILADANHPGKVLRRFDLTIYNTILHM